MACRHLRRAGLSLVVANFRCRLGELDLVMRDAQMLIVIEVRYRGPGSRISAAASVSPAKQRKIVRATEYFLATHPRFAGLELRFDLVCIDQGETGAARVQWLSDAFRPSW